MHAIFHDAYGNMRNVNNMGSGYVYTLSDEKSFKNSMLLGHFSRICFGQSWIFWGLIISITFPSNRFNFFDVENGWVSPAQAKFPANNLFAMPDVESNRSNCYYS